MLHYFFAVVPCLEKSQLTFTSSKSTMERQNNLLNLFKVNIEDTVIEFVLVSLFLTLNRFHIFFW